MYKSIMRKAKLIRCNRKALATTWSLYVSPGIGLAGTLQSTCAIRHVHDTVKQSLQVYVLINSYDINMYDEM